MYVLHSIGYSHHQWWWTPQWQWVGRLRNWLCNDALILALTCMYIKGQLDKWLHSFGIKLPGHVVTACTVSSNVKVKLSKLMLLRFWLKISYVTSLNLSLRPHAIIINWVLMPCYSLGKVLRSPRVSFLILCYILLLLCGSLGFFLMLGMCHQGISPVH